MPLTCAHFKLADFLRPGESYHFAQLELTPDNGARYHDHDYHELFWVTRGRGEHRFNGRTTPLQSGMLFLIRPVDRHCVSGQAGSPLHLVNLAFPGRVWAEVRRRYFPDEQDWFEQPTARRMCLVNHGGRALLEYWMDRLAAPGRPRVALDGFLMELPQLLHATPAGGMKPVPEWLARARLEIAQPGHFVGGTPAFARLAGRSPSHVARAALRWLGQTPTDIVNAARMDFFASQLATTTRPILDIALDCGLTNLSHAYALFRRRFGLSPHRYRLRAHGIA